MKEIWIDITKNNGRIYHNSIVAVSSFGRIRKGDDTIEDSYLGQHVRYKGRFYLIHRLIALYFIKRVPGKHYIDHITHYPVNMNVNNVRNLRWCTQKENHNFEEAKCNHSIATIKCRNSVFGMKYYEHFGYSRYIDPKQYDREKVWFYRHGKCSWE